MKHPVTVTLLLVLLFVVAQVVGLLLVNRSIAQVAMVNGTITLQHTETAIGARPDLHGYQSFLYLLFGVLIGTLLLLLLIRFRKVRLWKFWFFLAVFLAQTVAFGVLLPSLVAALLALLLAAWKVWKPNPVVHNLTEVFTYAGIAVLLVPLFNVFWMLVVLLAISLYDAWAVWKSKHMVAMAEFQKQSTVFAGLMVPKKERPMPEHLAAPSLPPGTKTKAPPTTAKTAHAAPKTPLPKRSPGAHAILGGGDIAFPLLFTGAVMEGMIRSGVLKPAAFWLSLVVTGGATLALLGLFLLAKKDRYYPAMPFITAGCLVGWGLLWLAQLL